MNVLIVGAGLGGLSAALSLHAAGIEVRVVDAAHELRAVGVGINILPHATRELVELGLAGELAATGIPTQELIYHDRFGSRIWVEPRGLAAGYRWPQYSIHRGELQMLMLRAVRQRLGAGAVRAGLAIERFEQSDAYVAVELRDRRTGRLLVEPAGVLIGADGINSAVRAQLHPGEGPPIWSGVHLWRGLTETEPFLGGRTMILSGANPIVVAYPVSRSAEQRGRSAVNWGIAVRLGRPTDAPLGDWHHLGGLDDVLPHVADRCFDWLDVPALVRAAPRIWEYPMVDRDPLPHWGTGRVSLLGDAAHPMYPMGSNGGTQAIIDGRVLAWELARADDPVTGLAAYEAARRERMNALVVANRQGGPERVLQLVEQRAPDGFTSIEDVMTRDELEAIAAQYRKTAGFDAETLNAAPSWNLLRRPPSGSE
ncbi:MAG: flavin-dependent oxidoreductase [Actinomycetota bacterium]|nr:flavin-dependent oxidoreductase [Actinomycetota bacterium]